MRATFLILAATLLAMGQNYQNNIPVNHPSIRYEGSVNDAVARLSKQLAEGKARLEFRTDGFGYLTSLLEKLGINKDTQALVFSKTGLQSAMTSPRTPRAIYFGNDVAVGFVRGSDLELVATDPRQGAIFYTLPADPAVPPKFVRESMCLQCHQGPATSGIPGMYVGSVFPTSSGAANFRSGAIVTDHRTPFEDRWGGWYVTGTHGSQKHRGNAVAMDPSNPFVLETEDTQNLTNLASKFDTSKYLLPSSDIAALMTFEHQTQMTNLMIRAGWEARTGEVSPKTIEDLVTYMTFADEMPLKEPITGISTFTKTFPQRGPRDKKGRSLRDFDLKTRLFRYPLSYMIYSETFDAMPEKVLAEIFSRLNEKLKGTEALEILRDTRHP